MKRIAVAVALVATMAMAQNVQTNQINQTIQTNQTVQSQMDKAILTTNVHALARLVQNEVVPYADALSRAEAAGWTLPNLVKMTRFSYKVTPQQISAMLSRVDFAAIEDPFYMTYACELLNINGFCLSQDGKAFQAKLTAARPAWAVVTHIGRKDAATQAAALAACETDKCVGCNILLIARRLSETRQDFTRIYRHNIWDGIPSDCLFAYGMYYILPHHKAGAPAAAVMSDWIAACWKNGMFNAYIPQRHLDNILNIVEKIDTIRGNKNASINMFERMTQPGFVGKSINERFLFTLVRRTGNSEWMLDRIIETNGNLTPEDLEAFIKVVSGLDIDYQPAKVIKALKTANQRYTLKLYEDRQKWEPILSKIRALIDVRS